MASFRFVEWLLFWLLETEQFDFEWDEGNRDKNETKHGIGTREVEEVFEQGLSVPLGVQVTPEVDEERLGIVGATREGKALQVVFTLREGRVRPISARPAHKKERKQYEKNVRKIFKRI